MPAAAANSSRHEQQHHARCRAMVRFNGLMFYGIAAASLLEAAVPLHAGHLAQALRGPHALGPWLDQVWCPERARHSRALRAYVAATWPEFDGEAYELRYGREAWRRSAAMELLWCCVTEAQISVFYRALARCADEAMLRELAHCAARDHVRYFEHFRHMFDCCPRRERVGFGTAWRMLLQFSRGARDREVALAFHVADRHWNGQKAFVALRYGEFLSRMGMVISRHAGLGPIQRLLFRPWAQPLPGSAALAHVQTEAVRATTSAARAVPAGGIGRGLQA